jgi:hypothetical protein
MTGLSTRNWVGFEVNMRTGPKVRVYKHDENRTLCCPSQVQSLYRFSTSPSPVFALRICNQLRRTFGTEPCEKRNAVIVRKLLLHVCYAGQSTRNALRRLFSKLNV